MFVSGRDNDFIGTSAMDGTQYTSFIKTADLPLSSWQHNHIFLHGLHIDAKGKLTYYNVWELMPGITRVQDILGCGLTNLQRASCAKYLGIILDDELLLARTTH